MRAKLAGFLDRRDTVARTLSDRATPACRRATPAPSPPTATPTCAPRSRQIDALIQAQPNNPYFHELKGQALLEGGKPAEAIAPLRRAVKLAPSPALIQVMLAQALNATNDPQARRRGGRAAARGARPRAGNAGRLRPARHGLRPQGRPRPGRSRLRSGRVHPRRLQDRARARHARQDPLRRRLARLGQGRRHRELQAAQPASTPTDPTRTRPNALFIRALPSPPRSARARRRRRATRRRISDAQRSEIERIIREYLIEEPGGAAGGDRRAREAPGRGRRREAQGRGQGQCRGAVQLAAPRRGRQSEGRRHLRRVLRLQLRLLQARAGRHDGADEGRPQAEGRAQGVSGARPGLGRGRARSASRCACRTRPARNISNSTRSC